MSSSNAPEVVRRYAVTLLDAAQETGVEDAVAADLQGLKSSIDGSQELRDFLGNRLVDGASSTKALVALFDGKVDGLTSNFLQMVAQRRRANLLEAIVDTALHILAERAGVATAQVRAATELTAEQVESLQQRLSAHTGQRVQVEVDVDDSLTGGIIVRIGDRVFDGSVETQLTRLRRRLVGSAI